ncbi:MAG: hypothetical protein COC19_04655 [SAR86 cluster bacterium]|uniref:Uncharacterized protein n=1 Tax=SAR86 cluster bacterium TaxID=2030880 RepID=A0A2A4MP54_9GAMM|nr:MAG: hypothetical protein COC19_04655 [SAR86 cluster bacterium]
MNFNINRWANKTLVALGTVLLFSGHQQSLAGVEETFMANGPLQYYGIQDASGKRVGYDGSWEATVTYDTSKEAEIYYNASVYPEHRVTWHGSISSIEYTIFSSDGEELFHEIATLNLNDDSQNYSKVYKYAALYHARWPGAYDYQHISWSIFDSCHNCSHYSSAGLSWFDSQPNVTPFLEAMDIFPTALDGENWQYSSNVFAGQTDASRSNYWEFHATTSNIFEGGDLDDDGIPNGLDACPESDLSITIVIADDDTDVDNTLLSSGCTITDMIDLLDNETAHGAFVSAVADILNLLKDEGIISGKEKGAIQSAIAKSKSKSKSIKNNK